jgi:hypothetical protein
MRLPRCDGERDLLDALSTGRWPEACDEELREHVEGCVDCREVLLVADALLTDRRDEEQVSDVPASGAVWWRMQLRMEREAKEVAEKTVGRVHGAVIAITVAAITLILVATSVMKAGSAWLESMAPWLSDFASLTSSLPLALVAPLAVALLVFAPVAVYLAVARE